MADINEGKPWSDLDDADLALEASTGETIDHAATVLCRSPEEIAARAIELGLAWRAQH